MRAISAEMQDWADEARHAQVWDVLCHLAPANSLKRRGVEAVGPCPVCGGTDRFSVNLKKNVWHCRVGGKGGDAIALAQYILSCDFKTAVQQVTGRPPPNGEQTKGVNEIELKRRATLRAQSDERNARAQNDYRQREISRARKIWDEGKDWHGSAVAIYMQRRAFLLAPGARIRFHAALKYWHYSEIKKEFVVLHEGAAMVARIDAADHSFLGVHCTWLDINTAKGKAEIVNPETGELLDAKKVRGSQRGGHIHLGGDPAHSLQLFVGEGIETVSSVSLALTEAQRPLGKVLFWASVNLGNLGGPALASVKHPYLTKTDKGGRRRDLLVPGPIPKCGPDVLALMPPEQVCDVVLLGDGDSDHFSTQQVLQRAAQRWAAPGRVIRAAWAAAGRDFNDMAMAEAELVAHG